MVQTFLLSQYRQLLTYISDLLPCQCLMYPHEKSLFCHLVRILKQLLIQQFPESCLLIANASHQRPDFDPFPGEHLICVIDCPPIYHLYRINKSRGFDIRCPPDPEVRVAAAQSI